MKDGPHLVNLSELRQLMADVDLKDPKLNEYVNARWLNYVEWWDSRSRQAKRTYHALRGTVVVCGALIPALVGLRELERFGKHAWIFSVASILVSLTIAICSGLEALGGFGDIWREKRLAAELIKSEGFSFLQLSGKYGEFPSHKEAHKLFATSVEKLICREVGEYMSAVSAKPDRWQGEKSTGHQ